MSLLTVDSVDISHRGRRLVRDVGFSVDAGTSVGIVGESGSGKSLTVRSLVGLLPAGVSATGSVTFDGWELLGLPERGLRTVRGGRISLLMQDPFSMLNPVQTVFAHVAEGLAAEIRRNRAKVRAEVHGRLEEVGLDPARVARRYPFQLSGGMRQRVALAAALAGDPDLLIADEPTTALDATTQAQVLAMLDSLRRRRGMALVLVTHDLGVAFSVCDRIMVMYAGSLVEQAPADELRRDPRHPYTAGLLGSHLPVDRRVETMRSIPGRVPPADSVGGQCGFASRCAWAVDACRAERPLLTLTTPGHTTACLRVDEIAPDLLGPAEQEGQDTGDANVAAPGVLLTVRDLRKSYRDLSAAKQRTDAVKGVSFDVGVHESVGLVGESGSGKTTIARTLLGLARPDSGTIGLGGLDLTDYRRLSREQSRGVAHLVQVVFQDPYSSLNPARTIGATLREAITARDRAADHRAETAELLAQVGLTEQHARRRPAQLSGGERQRIAIARAVALRPRLLICDEPVAALDVSVRAEILTLLRELQRRYRMSMLFITHELSVVRQMTDRVLVLYRGEIVEQGRTALVLDNPGHEYTARLVGSVLGLDQEGVTR
ncbi:ABC transporter ATP-binding protein [Actinosynnema sp. NPDC047251]|uniref:ABC-type transporter, ATPase subunit n=1 Tax=Saccharothrix espanaensis (strain ATCC 51144 / DSM 44229 / JCM 9112 / NBRC 15066 / NRRL 15764) TaxID=1179773 RepID=K0JX74_SACES|nr:ABC transporter ATP-binding protein [Saccharothrix espanaensis]CCH32485.1 ABC-type transporter, ATPase subunit [Saccharothrix espanaensis DSM 44229]